MTERTTLTATRALPSGPAPVSAADIARALGLPPPTAQQQAVIEADLGPSLVVAGAGSGKTETMANRVLWLLANGKVSAGEVLGLTFTRKAAGELAERIRTRIADLARHGLVVGGHDPFDPPTVATYNSFANTIFRDNAIRLGRESDGAVLGEASAWQLARSVVVSSPDDRLPDLGRSVDSVTKDVISLSRAISENVVDPADVVRMADEFRSVADLPRGGQGAYAAVDELVARVGALPVLVDLAARFAEEKRRRGFVEYSDQVALALEIVRGVPAVAAELRLRHRIVLLDEYQDTSVVQTWLLSELFSAHPVMAVGDPNQSIYGWRGASAANLESFADQFAGEGGAATVGRFALSTSWRNGRDILRVANGIVAPAASGGGTTVSTLTPSPSASADPVEVLWSETLEEEADAAAGWLAAKLAVPLPDGRPPSASMLFRTRRTQAVFIEALRRHEVPFHVLGVGGLMAEPEIADLVCALRVVDDPTAGAELIRLLAGSRWRLGVRDIAALKRVASWLAGRDHAHQLLDEELRAVLRGSLADGEGGSIVDALDFVASARPDHVALEGISPTGVERLRDAGITIGRLRARSGLDLLDLVTFVEQELMLDIEVVANDARALGSANMDAFFDALTSYLSVDERASLGGFLGWLREAEWRDDLTPRPEEPERGTVQLMTIHAAKGLEHDLVVVPRMVEGELPAAPNEGFVGWLSYGSLPYEFRGDSSELPVFAWRAAETRKELIEAQDAFKEEVRARSEREERRLAYVAVTRARHSLLITGSFWGHQVKPRGASPFLVELVRRGLLAGVPEASQYDENPLGGEPETLIWPLDPLGRRREVVERAAAMVEAASPGLEGEWAHTLDVLLEERRRLLRSSGTAPLPGRVPASRFKDYLTDPASVARDLRRPMPERPYRATRLGTLFHSWVENRYGMTGSAEVIDAVATEMDADGDAVDRAALERLQATFERSEWARRRPVEVEREVHLPFDGRIVVCKIDAVYSLGPSGAEERFQVVDWKTGRAPKDAADLEQKQVQLALYRLAYARWRGIDPDRIDAVFYFVADDETVAPHHILDEAELLERWRAAVGTSAADDG